VAYLEYQREISLPIYSKMSDADVQDVIDAVEELISKRPGNGYQSLRAAVAQDLKRVRITNIDASEVDT
jgi:aspartate/methionine/tyrosine aminotransferase